MDLEKTIQKHEALASIHIGVWHDSIAYVGVDLPPSRIVSGIAPQFAALIIDEQFDSYFPLALVQIGGMQEGSHYYECTTNPFEYLRNEYDHVIRAFMNRLRYLREEKGMTHSKISITNGEIRFLNDGEEKIIQLLAVPEDYITLFENCLTRAQII